MPKLTGSQVVAQTLKNYGVEYVAGIPGHGIWTLTDAFLEEESKLKFIQVFHEQSAVHLADGYYRVSGKPMAAVTSIGAGASNTVIGMATAFTDSTSLMLITGGPPTHMRGHGLLQELERYTDNDFPKIAEAVSKRHWVATRVEEMPFIMHRAWSSMMTGRPGPVHIEIPMDVQAEAAEVNLHAIEERTPVGKVFPDPAAVAKAADVLREAKRPVMVIGGGVITGEAWNEVLALAELWQIPVVTTWNGKSGFPEDHPLFAGSVGQTGTLCGNAMASSADVILAVGCRFTDWSSSSYAKGVTFSIPPGRLIHIDIDPHEIGKNYPVTVGIVSDAKYALAHLADALKGQSVDRSDYMKDLLARQTEWEEKLATRRDSDRFPFTSQRPLGALRKVFPRDTIVVVGSGNTQGAVKQTFPVYQPRTHLTSGGFSSMGWAVPAAIGAKLAAPDQPVVCILGDGDFLMTNQEIAICKTNGIPVVFIIQNNAGYMSIRGGQRKQTSRHIGTEFNTPDGEPYSPDYKAMGESFGLRSWRVERPEDLEPILKQALECNEPVLIEVPTDRDAAGPWVPGWWDFPIPEYITDERQDEYWELRNSEQHL
ncbi:MULTISPECIES: thiamine pyrophosphate-binding protein [Pseudomonas]|uniref:thiamine pyrophosphate-binding protein n=1 Tax=Pseudomonas TaxID=286 RepID=UPI0005EB9064|nr:MULTISPECIES: thiamine pyrophosphate-binding protein [Pseudomonas]KJJ94601.1 acetolactate synthase [Pseudomonas sp. 21]MBV7586198.1 thiamine pyrophosphate-binding protein [Pseudomonas sp. PDM33]NMZ61020.1 thiamine pyrophosphate-binding protein [Pseudomonas nitroreducens]SNT47092.1 acetolactate synthase-1/2/3 large subunit [Pseudomonas nitroreducens]